MADWDDDSNLQYNILRQKISTFVYNLSNPGPIPLTIFLSRFEFHGNSYFCYKSFPGHQGPFSISIPACLS